jgi:hypothetical protein
MLCRLAITARLSGVPGAVRPSCCDAMWNRIANPSWMGEQATDRYAERDMLENVDNPSTTY